MATVNINFRVPTLTQLAGEFSPELVIETFREYAETGSHICANTALKAIEKANLTNAQLQKVQAHIKTGICYHAQRGLSKPAELREAEIYADVYNRISRDLK